MRTAILQCADQGPAESTAVMLRSVGYNVYLPNKRLRDLLRSIGCDTVLSPRDLSAGMGYDPVDIPEIGPEAMETCDLYCDVKAHRCYDKVVKRWPRLKGKVLWTRINGARPEHVINQHGDHGDEVNPPCPVLTPNLWYQERWSEIELSCQACLGTGKHPDRSGDDCSECNGTCRAENPWFDRAYACWPPFVRFDEYNVQRNNHRGGSKYAPPICLIHSVKGWGYQDLVEPMRSLGVRCYGAGSPDGLIQHREVKVRLSDALCLVHLKSSDAPGYSLLESLAAACPVVCTRRLIWRCKMESLFIPGETCLVFDRETHDGLTAEDVASCTKEVAGHLERLSDPAENRRIGEAGRQRLKDVMWDANKAQDVESLRQFMARNFK